MKKNTKAVSNEEIIAALLQHGTIKEAAAAAGTSSRTIYDRMKEREFTAEYASAKADILRDATIKSQEKLSSAIDTIADIMTDKGVNAAIRLQAAQTILSSYGKFAEKLESAESLSRNRRMTVKEITDEMG